jgi:hypothetical protein
LVIFGGLMVESVAVEEHKLNIIMKFMLIFVFSSEKLLLDGL